MNHFFVYAQGSASHQDLSHPMNAFTKHGIPPW
jgi:hypothetical protein